MARKPKRDMTMEQQLAAGPVDLPFLMLTLMLVGIGLIMVFSASYATAYYDSSASVQNNPLYYIKRQSVYAVIGLVAMYWMSKMNYQHWRLLKTQPERGVQVESVSFFSPGKELGLRQLRKLFLVGREQLFVAGQTASFLFNNFSRGLLNKVFVGKLCVGLSDFIF